MSARNEFDVQHAVDPGQSVVIDAGAAAGVDVSGAAGCDVRRPGDRHRHDRDIDVDEEIEDLARRLVRAGDREAAVHRIFCRRQIRGVVQVPVESLRRAVSRCGDERIAGNDVVRGFHVIP